MATPISQVEARAAFALLSRFPRLALAVSGGWDTDSAGATVGAICGALFGGASLPASWTDPLGERFRTTLPGFDGVTAGELTTRTRAVAS